VKTFILIVLSYSISFDIPAQVKSFEYNNPEAIQLNDEKIDLLTSQLWRVYKTIFEYRGHIIETSANESFSYNSDFSFSYYDSQGVWTLIDQKYIRHQLNMKGDEGRLNFGGIYSVTTLTDSTLILTKLLTSSHDMKRTMYLKPESHFPPREEYGLNPFYYWKDIQKNTLDSIGNLSDKKLFSSNLDYIGDTLFIPTIDSLYIIIKKHD
jgi:hypothetical protein